MDQPEMIDGRESGALQYQSQTRIEFRVPSPPTFDDAAQQTVTLMFQSDPTRDMFQLGRAVNGGNDFVVPGVLHVDDEGCTTGPISRWACRIECERLPPFRSFVYACGFDPVHKVSQTAFYILLSVLDIDIIVVIRLCLFSA